MESHTGLRAGRSELANFSHGYGVKTVCGGSPILLFNLYRWFFPGGQSGWEVQLITHLHKEAKTLVPILSTDAKSVVLLNCLTFPEVLLVCFFTLLDISRSPCVTLCCIVGHLLKFLSYASLYCWTCPASPGICFVPLFHSILCFPQLLFLFSVFFLFCFRSQACQGVLYVMLGSAFNINKSKDQRAANVWNNVVLAMGIVTTILNVIISAFDMRETDMMGSNSTTTPSPPSQ